MFAGFIALIIVAALVFANVYGPHLITLLIKDIQDRKHAERMAALRESDLEVARNIASINTQLAQAFGPSDESRRCEQSLRYITTMREAAKAWLARETVDEEAATELYVECEWFDDEIDVVLSDETLSASEKCQQVVAILERSK